MIKTERKVIVRYIDTPQDASRYQVELQSYLDSNWQLEHTEHTSNTMTVFLYRYLDPVFDGERDFNIYVGREGVAYDR